MLAVDVSICAETPQEQQEHLPRLVEHMENTSVAEALAHLLGADDLSATFMAPSASVVLSQVCLH